MTAPNDRSTGTEDVVAIARVFAITNLTEEKDIDFFFEQLAHCSDRDERRRWVRAFRNQMISVGAGEALHGVAQSKRISGATDIVDEAACLIWAELCPGMVMGDDDRQHYENAAKAVLALTSTHQPTIGE